MKSEKGKRYKVIDENEFFEVGEIVVALENDDIPYCVREKDYADVDFVRNDGTVPISCDRLEEIGERCDQVMKIEKGKRYKVIGEHEFFGVGETVVALEEYGVPHCIRESAYMKGKNVQDYAKDKVRAISCYKLAEIEESDEVNHPKHYFRDGAMECFDEFVMIYGKEAAIHACLFNIHKYRYRAADKNGMEDLKKSDWYMKKYKELKGE